MIFFLYEPNSMQIKTFNLFIFYFFIFSYIINNTYIKIITKHPLKHFLFTMFKHTPITHDYKSIKIQNKPNHTLNNFKFTKQTPKKSRTVLESPLKLQKQ